MNLAKTMLTTPKAVLIRCGTPDCDWGTRYPILRTRSRWVVLFGVSNCIELHDPNEWDSYAQMKLDLEDRTLTLLK